MRRALVLLLTFVALAVLAVAARGQEIPFSPAGAPPGAAVDSDRTQETLAPGVGVEQFTRTVGSERARVHVVRADLSSPAVTADLLYPGAVTRRELVTASVTRAGAIAGINGDFFDIESDPNDDRLRSDAPDGAAVAAGELLKSRDPVSETGGAKTALVGADEVGRLRDSGFEGSIALPGGATALGGLNRFRLNGDEIGVYTSRWGEYTRRRPVDDAAEVRSVLVRGGKVVDVRAGKPADAARAGAIPADGFELVGRAGGARRLAGLEPGTAVGTSFGATFGGSAPGPLRFAIGGVAYLVRDGKLVDEGAATGVDRPTYPRSAVGFGPGGRTLLLVTIDGRQAQSSGLSRTIDFAKLLQDLGAADALHLDGGGSATLAARRPGADRATVVNSPSDGAEVAAAGDRMGVERAVPNGVGVFYDPGGRPGPALAGVSNSSSTAAPVRQLGARFTAGFTAARPSVLAGRRLRLPLFASERARVAVEVRRGGRRLGRFVRRVGPGTAFARWRRPRRGLPVGRYALRLSASTPSGATATDRATLLVRRR